MRSECSTVLSAHHELEMVKAYTTTRHTRIRFIKAQLRTVSHLPTITTQGTTTMSSANDKKRAASPAGTPPAPKRSQITASPEMTSDIADDREESTTTSVAMHSRAVAELFPEVRRSTPYHKLLLMLGQHYAASNGRVSPRHASEMTEEHQLAVAVARFRPLDGPLPAGFDIESLPVYRGPMSHLSMTAVSTGSDARVTPNATAPEESAPVSAPEDDAAVNEPAATAVDDPIAVDSTPEAPEDQICHWASCTKTFSGFNGPTLLWVCSSSSPFHTAKGLTY